MPRSFTLSHRASMVARAVAWRTPMSVQAETKETSSQSRALNCLMCSLGFLALASALRQAASNDVHAHDDFERLLRDLRPEGYFNKADSSGHSFRPTDGAHDAAVPFLSATAASGTLAKNPIGRPSASTASCPIGPRFITKPTQRPPSLTVTKAGLSVRVLMA